MSDRPQIYQSLEILGLDAKEAEIYVLLLQRGDLSVLGLSKYSSIPRSSIYRVCESIQSKGFVVTKSAADGDLYSAIPPSDLGHLSLVKQQELELTQKALDELAASDLLAVPSFPTAAYIKSTEDFRKFLFDMVDSSEKLCFTVSNKYLLSEVLTGNFMRELERRQKKIQLIYPGLHEEFSNKLIEVRNPQVEMTGIQVISDSSVCFVEGDSDNLQGICLEKPTFAQMQKLMFETFWQTLVLESLRV
jgi:sugar-specific transcriptional regulator TrmB